MLADDRMTTESVAGAAMKTDAIVLRESDTRRLILKTMIADKPDAPVRGVLGWQRIRADEG